MNQALPGYDPLWLTYKVTNSDFLRVYPLLSSTCPGQLWRSWPYFKSLHRRKGFCFPLRLCLFVCLFFRQFMSLTKRFNKLNIWWLSYTKARKLSHVWLETQSQCSPEVCVCAINNSGAMTDEQKWVNILSFYPWTLPIISFSYLTN